MKKVQKTIGILAVIAALVFMISMFIMALPVDMCNNMTQAFKNITMLTCIISMVFTFGLGFVYYEGFKTI